MTGATSGAGTAYPSGAPEFTPVFSGILVTRSLVFCVMRFVFVCGGSVLLVILAICVVCFVFVCGIRVVQSFVFCVMVGRLLVGFVCLNL